MVGHCLNKFLCNFLKFKIRFTLYDRVCGYRVMKYSNSCNQLLLVCGENFRVSKIICENVFTYTQKDFFFSELFLKYLFVFISNENLRHKNGNTNHLQTIAT